MTAISRRNLLALAAALLTPATAESAYRIDATIFALGMTVNQRRCARCAFVYICQEQARGLNRYGSLEESVTAQGASCTANRGRPSPFHAEIKTLRLQLAPYLT